MYKILLRELKFDTFWKVSWQDLSQTVPKSCSRQTLIFYSSYAKDFTFQLIFPHSPSTLRAILAWLARMEGSKDWMDRMGQLLSIAFDQLAHPPACGACYYSSPLLHSIFWIASWGQYLYQLLPGGVCGQRKRLVEGKMIMFSVCVSKYWSTIMVYPVSNPMYF